MFEEGLSPCMHIKAILQQVLIKTDIVVIAGGHLPGKICDSIHHFLFVLCPSFLICSVAFTNICPRAHVCRFNAVMNFCIMHIFWMCNGLSVTANGSRLIIASKSVQWLDGESHLDVTRENLPHNEPHWWWNC